VASMEDTASCCCRSAESLRLWTSLLEKELSKSPRHEDSINALMTNIKRNIDALLRHTATMKDHVHIHNSLHH
jgi:hypothetical protein